jgi:hypothetical protein
VRDGKLIITSREEAQTYLTFRLYPVGDLVPGGKRESFLEQTEAANPDLFGRRPLSPAAEDWLVKTIKDTVFPDHWRDAGGAGEIEWAPHVPLLVCSIDQEGHTEVERLLADLRKHGVRSAANSAGETRQPSTSVCAYPIAGDPASRAKLADEAARLIQEKIAPGTWNAKDTDAFIRAWPDRIVVRQTADVHRQVQNLLQEVELLQPPGTAKPPAPPSDD